MPSEKELEKFTQTALANLRYPLLAQAKLPPRENQTAVPVPERVGEPSVFQHVIYIIKENRTYDQVLGDVATATATPDLCIFGETVTPNEHKFVARFCSAGQHLLLQHLERRRPSMDGQRHRDGLYRA